MVVMDIEERVKKILIEQLGVKEEEITPRADIVEDLGAHNSRRPASGQSIRRLLKDKSNES